MPTIEGPYSFKAVDGLKTPAYIFEVGGERKHVGEVTVKVDGGMTFDIQLDEKHQDIYSASFDVPMRYTYLNRPDTPQINWGYNCLTTTVHHGRPEALWNLPLLHAIRIFRAEPLKELVITRIYQDALQFVERGPDPSGHPLTQEWADQVKAQAEERYLRLLKVKVGELVHYYESSGWQTDVEGVVELVKQNKLNPRYQPLHSHDSINLFCRILGQSSVFKAS